MTLAWGHFVDAWKDWSSNLLFPSVHTRLSSYSTHVPQTISKLPHALNPSVSGSHKDGSAGYVSSTSLCCADHVPLSRWCHSNGGCYLGQNNHVWCLSFRLLWIILTHIFTSLFQPVETFNAIWLWQKIRENPPSVFQTLAQSVSTFSSRPATTSSSSSFLILALWSMSTVTPPKLLSRSLLLSLSVRSFQPHTDHTAAPS